MKKYILFALFLLSACGGDGQHLYVWENENVDQEWFAKDHNECLKEADYFPFSNPGWPWQWGNPYSYEYRVVLDNDSDNGIWAELRQPGGYLPIFVNSKVDDWSMVGSVYSKCMRKKGYKQIEKTKVNRQIVR